MEKCPRNNEIYDNLKHFLEITTKQKIDNMDVILDGYSEKVAQNHGAKKKVYICVSSQSRSALNFPTSLYLTLKKYPVHCFLWYYLIFERSSMEQILIRTTSGQPKTCFHYYAK